MTLVVATKTRTPLTVTVRPSAAAPSARLVPPRRTLVVRADKDPEQAAKDAGRNIQDGLSGALNKGEEKVKNLSDQAGDVLEDSQSEGRRQADKAEDSARDAAGKVKKEGKGFGESLKDSIRGAADAISGKAKDVKRNID